MIDDNDPSVYLVREPSAAGLILIQQCNRHSGAETPFWMLAEVAVRQHQQASWIGDMDGLFRKIRRYSIAGIVALATNLAAIAGYAVHRIAATAAFEEHAANQERAFIEYRDSVRRELQDLKQDLRDMRRDLRRLSGADKLDPESIHDEDVLNSDEKFTELGMWNEILADGKPPGDSSQVIHPDTCFQTCSSSVECGGAAQLCKFCNFGECRSTRPENPTPAPTPPPDAGIDASTTTQ